MQPNILFIMADQMAAPALPMYGNAVSLMPNLQALTDTGVLFENCYCNLPMCAPSRASLHQLHGYHKRHTTEIYPANFGWTVDWSKGREYRPTNLTMAPVIESGTCVRSLQMDYDDEVEYHGVQAIYDLARKPDDNPFFLTVSFTSPHSPFVISQEYWDLYDHDAIELPKVAEIPLDEKDHLSRNLHYCQARHQYTVTDEHRRNARHAYYGMLSYIDDKIGSLVTALERAGLRENTLVVFTSDHGEMMGERGMWFKQHFFEWAAHVPLVMSMPSRFQASRVTKNVSLIDLMPTFLDLAADQTFDSYMDPPDGQSLLSALHGDSGDLNDIVISEFAADGSTGPSRLVKKDTWKYMYLEGVDTLLFNLDTDPHELTNLSGLAEHAAIEAELAEIAFRDWDPEQLRLEISKSQQRRLTIHSVTNGEPTYVIEVRKDDNQRYVRNAGAADTKARARLPYVAPALPD